MPVNQLETAMEAILFRVLGHGYASWRILWYAW
jgi:hypothetical protein